MSLKVNLQIDQGADFSADITIVDINGTAVSLAGYVANAMMRKHYTSSNTSAIFATTIQSSNGIITVSIPGANTANIGSGRYVWDCFVTNQSTNAPSRIVEGIVTVTPSVTHG